LQLCRYDISQLWFTNEPRCGVLIRFSVKQHALFYESAVSSSQNQANLYL